MTQPPTPPWAPQPSGLPIDATAEQLAELAAQRPDLWAEISAHPNCYSALRSWIAENSPAVMQAGYPTPYAAPARAARTRSKVTVWIAAGVAAALAISGGGVALALTDTWPFGEHGPLGGAASASASKVAQEEAAPTFADGIEEKWTVTGRDLGATAKITGHMPRMLGPINPLQRADQPVLLESGVLVPFRADDLPGDVPSSWTLLDPATGAPQWRELGPGAGGTCAPNEARTEAACSVNFVAGSDLVAFDADGIKFSEPSKGGYVQHVDGGWRIAGKSTVAGYDSDGNELEVQTAQGDSGSMLGNAGTTDCVWVSGGDTISYVGPGCDAPDSEVLTQDASFSWAVVGSQRPVILIDNAQQTTAFDATTREELWSTGGMLPGWFQAPQVVKREQGDGILVWNENEQSVSVVDVETGDKVTISTTASDRYITVSGDQVLAFSGNAARSISSVDVFDGATGKELYSGSFPEITEVAEVVGGPNGVLISHYFCDECSTAEGSHAIDSYTFMGPASDTQGTAQTVSAVAIPDSISIGCPADTILLAWAEFADGWVLVCGVSMTEPSFMAYQGPGSSQVLYSQGAQNPTSAEAKAAVDWDAALSRYTGELDGGDRLTLDNDIGTAVRRDADDRKIVEQQRFVRHVFVPLGETIRTMRETSQEDGAFDVQAPDDTAEDQVRYMIEVLEKAYAGRALVKDALPKLEYCTASAGGYSDTVSAMKAVRDNRSELLTALDAMPVDKIPEGSALLDDLYEAIETSYRANIEYVAWAEAANASGCASLSATGSRAAADSDKPKERFASRWNRTVAPKFGVRTFDAWYI